MGFSSASSKSPARKADAGSLAGLLAFTLRPCVVAERGALACFSRLVHTVGRNSGTVETLAPEFRRFFSQVCTCFYVVADDRTFYAQERKAYSCEVAFYRNTGTRETQVPEFRWAAGRATGYGAGGERRATSNQGGSRAYRLMRRPRPFFPIVDMKPFTLENLPFTAVFSSLFTSKLKTITV